MIAAYRSPQELGRSSLLGMTALARTPAEERRFRAMAYLLGDEHDPALLARPTTSSAEAVGFTEDERRNLRSLLRLIRARRTEEAGRLLNGAEIQPLLPRLAPWVKSAELQAVTAPNSTLSPPLLRQLLSLEIALSGGSPADSGEKSTAVESWSQLVARGGTKPVAVLSLETLTEFDPRQSVFRDRRWTEAD